MLKRAADSGLGSAFRRERKSARVTQEALAKTIGSSIHAIRRLEAGRGSLSVWLRALEALGLEVVGRNIGSLSGNELAELRRRRRLSLRDLAEAASVSQPTIIALERDQARTLQALDRIARTLGAGLYLAPKGAPRAFFAHAGNSSTGQSWETPKELLSVLYAVFGKFDLDPCSPKKTNPPVRAHVHYTAEDDGLSLPWHGVVFMNPPYGRTLDEWIAKARHEVESGNAKTVVALLPARPDTAYWHDHIAGRAVVYFLRGRLRFSGAKQAAPFPSALVLWGASRESLLALDRTLGEPGGKVRGSRQGPRPDRPDRQS